MTEIKDVIKHYRKLLGMSQEELGHKVGVSTSTIGMYEQGRRKPSFEVEEALADTFNIRLDTLRGKDDLETLESTTRRLMIYANALSLASKEKLLDYAETLSQLETLRDKEEG